MANIIDLIINGIQQAFEKMASFEFLGTNMLKFTITITIIGAILPVLLTLVNNTSGAIRGYREKRPQRERKEGK